MNILAEHHGALCRAFARSATEKFAGVSWRPSSTGLPILDEVVAWIECELHSVLDAGDHVCVLGKVLALDVEHPRGPLLFYRGAFGQLGLDQRSR